MSIKLMSAVFDVEMRDLKFIHTTTHQDGTIDDVESTVRASTAKFVLIALADHSNDYGEGAYPGISRLVKKTDLSRQAVIDALEALQKNGLITVNGLSRLGTNNYTINIRAFPKMADEAAELPELVIPADGGSTPSIPELVIPADHNHQVTVIEPSREKDWIDGMIELANMPGAKKATIKELHFELIKKKLHINPSGRKWEDFISYSADRQMKDKQSLEVFLAWALDNGYNPIYWTPDKMQTLWPQAFTEPEKEPEIIHAQPDPLEGQYVPAPGRPSTRPVQQPGGSGGQA